MRDLHLDPYSPAELAAIRERHEAARVDPPTNRQQRRAAERARREAAAKGKR